MKDKYNTLNSERFEVLKQNYEEFLNRLSDMTKEPYTVYAPLPQKAIEDLDLIREVSRNLQSKKDEDVKKQAQAANEAAEKAQEPQEAAEKAQEPQEEAKEETKPEPVKEN